MLLLLISEDPSKSSQQDQTTETLKSCNADEELSIVRNRTIAFLHSSNEESSEVPEHNRCSQSTIDESSTSGEFESHSSTDGNIRIRLKYLNDDQKLVEGKLQEPLGDFKRYIKS